MVFHEDVDSEKAQHGRGEDAPLFHLSLAAPHTNKPILSCEMPKRSSTSTALALPLRLPLLSLVVWI